MLKRLTTIKYLNKTHFSAEVEKSLELLSCFSSLANSSVRSDCFCKQPADNLSPEEAHYDTEKWVGREVGIIGTLRLFQGSTGPHYGIEDSGQNRVGIRDYSPIQP